MSEVSGSKHDEIRSFSAGMFKFNIEELIHDDMTKLIKGTDCGTLL